MLYMARLALFASLGVTFILLGSLLLFGTEHPFKTSNYALRNAMETEFSWEMIPARKFLEWHDCYVGRQCARLIVPLDHFNPRGQEAAIALIRLPSSFAPNSESYRGPILFNFGGPGISGVNQIRTRGDSFRAIIGPQFDIVGFDPRGLGQSTPRASMFKSDVERVLWYAGSGLVNTTDTGVARTWARSRMLGQIAAKNDDGTLRYINSEQTARDMLSIVEAHGQSKLQYWGLSYGTVLGSTFASIFPDKIERIILDGVVDANSFFGNTWSNKLVDTEKVLDNFFATCAEVGLERCAFWSPTAEEIRQKLDTLYESIRSQPIPVNLESTYGLVDYALLRGVIFKLLKTPYASFQPLAQGLADLAAGDGRWMLEKFFQQNGDPYECKCDASGQTLEVDDDTGTAITCNDHAALPDDLQWAQDYYKLMLDGSEWGDVWSQYLMECQGWPSFPKSSFRGPFQGNTSHPILLISNTIDPATPLVFANKMSTGFPGSVVLIQDALGHCSTVSTSACTHSYIRQYFIDGTLPEPGTVCSVDGVLFPDNSFLDIQQTDSSQLSFSAPIEV